MKLPKILSIVAIACIAFGCAPAAEAATPFGIAPQAAGTGLFQPYVSYSVGSWPEAVAIGDVNGDGRNDVVMTTSYYFDPVNDYSLFVFTQNANGTLNAPARYPTAGTYTNRPATVAIGDINNDGKNEVVVGDSGLAIEVYTQNPFGALGSSVIYSTINSGKVRIADLNNDGLPDVAGVGLGTNSVDVLLQNVAGTLDAPLTYLVNGGTDLDVGDANHDGLADLVVMNGTGLSPSVGVLLQSGAGGFLPAAYYSLSGIPFIGGVGVGDVSGDAMDDIVAGLGGNQPSSTVGVYTQNAGGTMNPRVDYVSYDIPESVDVADVDQDGRTDVVVLHGGWMQMGVYVQGANGQLQAEALYPIPYASHYNMHGLDVGDINGDGLNDVAIADYNNGLVILYHAPLAPTPDIKVNGSDGPVTLAVGSPLTVTVALNAGGLSGQNADWWVMADNGTSRYWYQAGTGWKLSATPLRAFGGPIINLPTRNILATSTLPAGSYSFYFAVDNNMDGVANGTWLDGVVVTIQ